MATRVNRFSSSTRGTPVVGEGNGEERDTDKCSAAAQSDPAPADLDYRYRLLAYEAGKRAKADGMTAAEVLCWQAGYDGEPLPEFEEDWR